MAVFRMERGPGGSRIMSQYATEEEGRNVLGKTGGMPSQTEREPVDRDELPATDAFAGSPAYNALAVGLPKQSIAWAYKYIEKLTSQEEIKRLLVIEKNHPKHVGGRKGIVQALEAKAADLDPTAFNAPETAEESGSDFSCSECEFKGGSVEGLEAHVNAVHDL